MISKKRLELTQVYEDHKKIKKEKIKCLEKNVGVVVRR